MLGALLLAILTAANPAMASPQMVDARGTLKGLPEFGIVVTIEAHSSSFEFSQAALKTQIELALRRSGIHAVEADALRGRGAILQASLVVLDTESKGGHRYGYAVSYTLEVGQPVVLLQRPDAALMASTWSKSGILVGSVDGIAGQLRDVFDGLLDQFCNDYLAANEPRKKRPAAATSP